MRSVFKLFLFFPLIALAFISCEEDEFSEKEAMEELRHIDMVLTVIDPGSYADVVEGVTVKVVGDSTSIAKTTDSMGSVVFEDLKIGGEIGVYIEKENYTRAFYRVNTSTNSYGQSQVAATLPVYALDGENMAVVKGQLTIETDLTNRSRETVNNREVRVVNPALGNNVESAFVTTTDDNGNYSVKVPVNASGNDGLQVYVPSLIETSQALAMEVENGVFEVVEVPAVYSARSSDYIPSDIPYVPSAIASVEAPGNVGSGFALGVEARPTPLDGYSNIAIIDGGQGYRADTIAFSSGVNGNAARVIVYTDGNGTITELDFEGGYYDEQWNSLRNGAFYTSEPTLDLSVLGGTGAELDIQFQCQYEVSVTDYGSNYKSYPIVSATYREYTGNEIVRKIDKNLNEGNELYDYYWGSFNSYLDLHYGSVRPNENYAYSGDILFVTRALAEAPALTVEEQTPEHAKINFWIGNDGNVELDNYTPGSGYDSANPPTVTVTGLAGYGNGAKVEVEVSQYGWISRVVVLDGGTGFVRNVNAYNKNGNSSATTGTANYDGSRFLNAVAPGVERIVNWYYGTGQRAND